VPKNSRTLVLGIGNILLRDEGAGIHALHELRAMVSGRDDVELMDGGTLSFTLAGEIEDAAHLIVIDAAQLDAAPGTTQVFVGNDMDSFVGGNRKRSVHEVGLIDLMAIARLTDRLPPQRALIGIQPQEIDWGEAPSPAVAAAIPVACRYVLALMEQWNT
jgi:hydrogenase maturation protease